MSRDVREAVKTHLPAFLFESELFSENMDSPASEMNDLTAAVEDVLDQFFIETADWGLAEWEEFLGLKTDESKAAAERRSVIKAKRRGVGTVTVALVQSVAEAYDNGEVEVGEDFATYTIFVRFVSNRGVPPNLNDIQEAIRETVPAHLQIDFKFTYLIWDELDAMSLTWNKLEAVNLTWDQLEVYNPGMDGTLDDSMALLFIE